MISPGFFSIYNGNITEGKIPFVAPRTSRNRSSLNRGSTVWRILRAKKDSPLVFYKTKYKMALFYHFASRQSNK